MKKIVYKYRFSKFRRFTSGLLFAMISFTALLLCFSSISEYPVSKTQILLPFTIAAVSLVFGFITMFHQRNEKDKAY